MKKRPVQGKIVRVCDINHEALQLPFHTLGLARAVFGRYLKNGAMYWGIHAAPRGLRDFLLTAIVDETSPNQRNPKQKLMVQGGTQYGCSARLCPFCVYCGLQFYRNLETEEVVDLFRLALFLHGKTHAHERDNRELILKLTDNGEPLETPYLPEVLDRLLTIFGVKGKILRLKISTIFMNTQTTRQTFQRVREWQEQHRKSASIHLQISRSSYGNKLIPAEEVREMMMAWKKANPQDPICIAPGLVRGYNHEEFLAFCAILKPAANPCFFRLSVIKPSTEKQKGQILPRKEMERINTMLKGMRFKVRPLPRNSYYTKQLEGAGTLSHRPNGKFYDPATYRVWKYASKAVDPNDPIERL